ncbi:MAG: N-acetylmuramoyl-L-alanine amidase [Pseudomonadota bacterium]
MNAPAVRWVPSPNFDRRDRPPDMVVLHYTDIPDPAVALRWLTIPKSRVSAHYLIEADGTLTQMVREADRAWHAGLSHWDGTDNVNGRSLGIELDNAGHTPQPTPFPEPQIAALLALLSRLRARWCIPPRNVVAHSDIAPMRKRDPGEAFPWHRLAEAGHCLAVAPDALPADDLFATLSRCGYGAADAHEAKVALVRAFHRRHRQNAPDAPADDVTARLAAALLRATAQDRLRSAH